jgi:transcriptional regulator with XRE-family HTH domain
MKDDTTGRTLTGAIGGNVRRFRLARRWTQDELAVMLRWSGLPLTQSGVAGIESGSRSIDVEEMVILAAVLGVSAAELLSGNGPVRLGDSAESDLVSVSAFLSGAIPVEDLPLSTPTTKFLAAAKSNQARINKEWPGARPAEIVKAERGADGLAEQKAARTLGVRPFDVSMAAIRLWGVSLTDHRNELVAARTEPDTPARTVQAIRGRITRTLIDEIKPLLKGAK